MSNVFMQLQSLSFHLVLLVLAAATAAECLAAIRAGESRRHWFFGAAAIWGAIALLIPIRVFEPMWIFLVSSPLIAVTLRLFRKRQSKRELAAGETTGQHIRSRRYSFGTRDLLLLTLLVAVSLTVFPTFMRPCRPENWAGWIFAVVTLANISVLAAVIAAGPRRWLAACILLVLLPAAASAMILTPDESWMGPWRSLGIIKAPGMRTGNIVLLLLFGSELTAILIVLLALVQASIAGRSGTRRTICRVALAAVVLAFVVPLSLVYVRLIRRTPHPPQLAVDDNHYDGILAIAKEVSRINPKETALINVGPTASKTQAAAQLDACYAELQSLLAGTSGVEYDPERYDDTAIFADSRSLRALSRCLDAESEALIAQGEDDHAADYALATMQLGAILQRGGDILHGFNGINFEDTGRWRLAQLRRGLSPTMADRVQAVLAKVASEREVRETRVARANADQDRSPWQNRLGHLISEMRPTTWSLEFLLDQQEASHRLLQADLAIRSFFRDHGELPADLRDLVPEYLPQKLIDPHCGQPLRYRPGASEFTLYSVGWDGRDDGGKFASWGPYRTESGWDLDLDTYTRP